ncbi:MAG TPA: GNAT family N-acetyltransferase [Candidatus Thermoplasmatota archaeon]|jgi:ribosomal protein S18 acetylase RimI-like enzyme|nr:GNAT family N-acetyltransferase [Candidatus Thermoplasmatota archaeon]
MEAVGFRPAQPRDAADVVAVVNGAYRGELGKAGWTHEMGLVAGPRISEQGFLEMLARPGSVVLVAERAGRVVACVHLEAGGTECFLGMLSVRVAEQASGLGRALLAHAEGYARERLGARVMAMHVVATRTELVAWYERRGYRRTGQRVPFAPRPGITLLQGPLEFERLEKALR